MPKEMRKWEALVETSEDREFQIRVDEILGLVRKQQKSMKPAERDRGFNPAVDDCCCPVGLR